MCMCAASTFPPMHPNCGLQIGDGDGQAMLACEWSARQYGQVLVWYIQVFSVEVSTRKEEGCDQSMYENYPRLMEANNVSVVFDTNVYDSRFAKFLHS